MQSRKYLPYKHNFLRSFEDVESVFIVVAMASEENAVLAGRHYKQVKLGKGGNISIKEVDCGGKKVLVGQSGVGLVNAGILLTVVLEHYSIDAVILLGVGGALDEKLEIGDTVISLSVIQHDSIASNDESNLFIAPGELTLSAPPDQQVDPVMRCDEVLVNFLQTSLSDSSRRIFKGTILSGSEFVANTSRKAYLRQMVQDALLVDMEAAALAQIARRASIPFVAAKTVADRATPTSSVSDDYQTFLEAAAEHSQIVINCLIGRK